MKIIRAVLVLFALTACMPDIKSPYDPTVRLDPPARSDVPVTTTPVILGLQDKPYAPAGLSLCAEMNFYRIQWGLPNRFDDSGHHQKWTKSDGLGWRESKCQNDVVSSTGCCGGYWQLYISVFIRDYRMKPLLAACDVRTLADVTGVEPYDKQRQACAARALYSVDPTAWRPM